jgi:hypothetical protein
MRINWCSSEDRLEPEFAQKCVIGFRFFFGSASPDNEIARFSSFVRCSVRVPPPPILAVVIGP